MTEVFIMRYGIWFVVSLRNPEYEQATGTSAIIPVSAFRDINEALSLRDALRTAASGSPGELVS